MNPRNSDCQRPSRASSQVVGKAGALAAIILLSPLLATIALAIRLDSRGPIFYLSPRIGQSGRPFNMIKFRTMIRNADQMGQDFCLEGCDDPRITRVGRLLRATSLDELPQLANVLRGEMNLVGPRPGLSNQVVLYDDHQKRRLEVRPGMTGLAQVSGRNTLSWAERIEKDIEYIDNWSIWLDIKILVRTVWVVVARRGLYSDHQQRDFL